MAQLDRGNAHLEAGELIDGDILPSGAAEVVYGHVRIELCKTRDGNVCARLAHVLNTEEEL